MALPRALSPGGCWPLPPAFLRPPPPECPGDACACLQTGCDGRARAGRRFRARRRPLQPAAGTCARGIPPSAEGSPADPLQRACRSMPMAQAAAGGGGMTSLPPAPAAGRRASHLHAVARTAPGHVSADPAGDGRCAARPRHRPGGAHGQGRGRATRWAQTAAGHAPAAAGLAAGFLRLPVPQAVQLIHAARLGRAGAYSAG